MRAGARVMIGFYASAAFSLALYHRQGGEDEAREGPGRWTGEGKTKRRVKRHRHKRKRRRKGREEGRKMI